MKYYFLVSGGRDSTAMTLQAFEKGFQGELVYGDTRINRAGALDVVNYLRDYTGWPLYIVKYSGEKPVITVLKESFLKIPKALEDQKRVGCYRRNTFQCCSVLKHKPLNDFIKSLNNDDDICLVLGIKGYDGAINRIYRMRQLRELDTYYRRHKKNGLLYYYPLRDMRDSDIDDILAHFNLQGVQHSGCSICPIFCLFENWRKKDPDTWRRSVQFADRLGIEHPASGQQFFRNSTNMNSC